MHPARSRVLRRWFVMSLILAISVIVLLRFTIFPVHVEQSDWRQTLGAVLDNLLASAVTSLVAGIALMLLFPAQDNPSVELIQNREIPQLIYDSTSKAQQWDVRARTASYFARVTLPLLRDAAFRTGGDISIRIQVLNPSNDAAMAAYARYRSNHAGAVWSVDKVKAEIFSTILAAAIYRNEAPRLHIQIGLSESFWVLSLDACEDLVVVTGQNKGDPALVIRQGSPLFREWREDFEASFSVCQMITPSIEKITRKDLEEGTEEVKKAVQGLFESLGMPSLTPEHVDSAIVYWKRKHNYE